MAVGGPRNSAAAGSRNWSGSVGFAEGDLFFFPSSESFERIWDCLVSTYHLLRCNPGLKYINEVGLERVSSSDAASKLKTTDEPTSSNPKEFNDTHGSSVGLVLGYAAHFLQSLPVLENHSVLVKPQRDRSLRLKRTPQSWSPTSLVRLGRRQFGPSVPSCFLPRS